jgi:tetratricopeptide (TPR) repeat protein
MRCVPFTRTAALVLGLAFAACSVPAGAAPAQTAAAQENAARTDAVGAPAEAIAETSIEKGFARLVIRFKDRNLLPQYAIKSSNGVVVLQFGEPVKIDVERIPLELSSFITVARRDPDGMAIRLALARQIKINTMDAGERLFVDLLPMTWQGPMPTLPEAVVQELAKRADAAIKAQREAENLRFGLKVMPKLDFRVGRQPTFTRFSFGWNVPFDTQMVRENNRVTLNFNRPAAIDLGEVLADPPAGLREISADNSDGKLKVIMQVAPEADVRAFREDQTYVLDLSGKNKPVNREIAAALKPQGEAHGMADLVEAPGRMVEAAAAPPPGDDVAIRTVPLDTGEGAPKPAKPVASVPRAIEAAKSAPERPVKPAMSSPVKAEAAAPMKPSTSHEPGVEPVKSAVAEPAPAPVAAEAKPPMIGNGEQLPEMHDSASEMPKIVRAEARRNGNMVRIAFPFHDRVASAAFKRDFSLWLIFDTKLPLDTQSIRAALGDLAANVVVGKVDQAQTVRIDLTQPALTTLGVDGNSWILSIGEMVLEPSKPLTLRRMFRMDQQGYLAVDLNDAGAVHDLPDPTIGDHMYVVTAYGPPRGLIKEQSFAELQALGTAHGIAIVPFADDLQVGLQKGVVTIGREKGLLLSPAGTDRSEAPIPKVDNRAHRVASDAAAFYSKDPAVFNETLKTLETQIVEAPDKERTAKRLQLADFFLGHRFAPEALGVLRLISQDQPGIERDPGFLVLFGAAQALAGRNKEARQILTRPSIANNADAAMWLTIADSELQNWQEGREAAQKAAAAVGAYPADLQAMFSLASASTSIELNDFGPAESRLAEILPDEIDPDLAVRFQVLQGRIMDAAGRPDDAMQRLDDAAQSSDRRAAAEAEYRRIVILHRDKKISNAEAINRLSSLSFSWRGDELELKTLRLLANLQAKEGQYRSAFNSMRSAIMVDPNADTTRKLQDEMNKEFLDLFLDGKADTMPPIAALTLYYDFRDMTPIGRQGDEIVRGLADRLVSVDLLDQAAELLNYQIDNRLRGVARAEIAADLAVVDLLNHKPAQALAVLNKTRQSSLPASVERQRRMVEARALSESGRGELASELLGPLIGSDVDRLKADIAWRAKNWRGAGERLETMLGGRWNDPLQLDGQERQDVLRAAISYALANDQLSLDRLRTKFGPKMTNSPNARAFDVVTAPIQSQGTEFRTLAKDIASIDTMRSFLDEYRQQYLSRPKATGPANTAPQKPDAPGPSAEAAKSNPNQVASAEAPAK